MVRVTGVGARVGGGGGFVGAAASRRPRPALLLGNPRGGTRAANKHFATVQWSGTRGCLALFALRARSVGAMHRPHHLVVRTSRCGRDNPGSTPGAVISAGVTVTEQLTQRASVGLRPLPKGCTLRARGGRPRAHGGLPAENTYLPDVNLARGGRGRGAARGRHLSNLGAQRDRCHANALSAQWQRMPLLKV